jgi:acyl-CoA synthetase (AMP-forming)/AMP-acid ligase II
MPRSFFGPFPDVEIPEVSLPAFVLERASELGDKPALIDGPTGRTLTYGQLAGLVSAVAAGLAARGLQPGEVVALFSPNIPEYAAAFHGVATAGAAITTINSLASTEEIASQMHATGARFLVTVGAFCDRALPAAEKAGVDEVFVMGDVPDGAGATPSGQLVADGSAALAAGSAPAPPAIDPATHIVAMPMSSGTTGFPKVVQLTHRNLVANVVQSSHAIEIAERDTLIGVLPFFHIYGMTVLVNLALWRGATVVTMPKFDLDDFLTLMEDHAVTFAALVPPIVLALAKHPAVDGHDLSALEHIITGAAPLDGSIAEAAAERLGCVVAQGYGLTETSPVLSAPTRDAERARPDTCGFILPNTEIGIAPIEEGADNPGVDEDGEIWARGPQVMAGYLDDPEANAWIFPGDGWLRTGDIGHVDADGYLSVVDRLKELIKYRGFQVPPAELEALLIQHPGIADAAVIPSPDPTAGEVPKAFVVRSPGSAGGAVSEGELMSWVGERVPSYKKVRRVEFIEEIPRSLSGKILRRLLVERERSAGSDATER